MLTFQKRRKYVVGGKTVEVKGFYINGFDDNDSNPEHAHLWIEQDPAYVNSPDAYKHIRVFVNKNQIDVDATSDYTQLKNRPTVGGFVLDSEGIIAGNNINITKNSEGKIVISSTGGGGHGDVVDVRINGVSILDSNKIANILKASTTQLGVVRVDGTTVGIDSEGVISVIGGGTGRVKDVKVQKTNEGYITVLDSEGIAKIDLSSKQNILQDRITKPSEVGNIKTINGISILGDGNVSVIPESEGILIFHDPIHAVVDVPNNKTDITLLYDDETIKFANNKLFVPIDSETIYINSEGKLASKGGGGSASADEKTIVTNSEGKVETVVGGWKETTSDFEYFNGTGIAVVDPNPTVVTWGGTMLPEVGSVIKCKVKLGVLPEITYDFDPAVSDGDYIKCESVSSIYIDAIRFKKDLSVIEVTVEPTMLSQPSFDIQLTGPATIYHTINNQYIAIDNDTITLDSEGKLTSNSNKITLPVTAIQSIWDSAF